MASQVTTMLRTLVEEKFYNPCFVHQDADKNEENKFCMDCCFRLCFNCVPHHRHHSILQIRRYMYNDVLLRKDARKLYDCSKIQSFIFNGEKVVLLRSKQHPAMRGSRCLVCDQHIKSSSVYCSLVCKLSVTASPSGQRLHANSSNNLDRSLLVSGSECVVSAKSSVEENSTVATTCDETVYEYVYSMKGVHPPNQKRSGSTSRKLHVRKCVPQRSPLF